MTNPEQSNSKQIKASPKAEFEQSDLNSSIASIHITISQIQSMATESTKGELGDLSYLLPQQERELVESRAHEIAMRQYGEAVVNSGVDSEHNHNQYIKKLVASVLTGMALVASSIALKHDIGVTYTGGFVGGAATFIGISSSQADRRKKAEEMRKKMIIDAVIANLARYQLAIGQFGVNDPRTISLAEKIVFFSNQIVSDDSTKVVLDSGMQN